MKYALTLILFLGSCISRGQVTMIPYPEPPEPQYGSWAGAKASFSDINAGYLVMMFNGGIPTPHNFMEPHFYKTTNGGVDWDYFFSFGYDYSNTGGVIFAEVGPEDDCYYAYWAGYHYAFGRLYDGGNSIKNYIAAPGGVFTSMCLSPDGTCFSVVNIFTQNEYRLIRVNNSDELDTLYSLVDSLIFVKPCFLDSLEGFLIVRLSNEGPAGIMHTTDGGESFEMIWTNDTLVMTDIEFASDQLGLIATKEGYLLKTFDGGEHWDVLPLAPGTELHDLFFLDSNTGYCGGNDGTLFKTTDGCVTWERQDFPQDIPIRKIMMFSESQGYIQGPYALYRYLPYTGIDERTIQPEIFPNPASRQVVIKSDYFIHHPDLTAEIFGVSGVRQVGSLSVSGKMQVSIDVSNLSSGLYLAVIRDGKTIVSAVKFSVVR